MTVSDRWRKRDPETGRPVRSARDGVGSRWEVRWREHGQQKRRAFDVKADALAFDAHRRLSPQRLAIERTVAQQHALWIAARAGLKASTLHDYRGVWGKHVEPVWGDRICGSILHGEVAAWVGGIAARSPSVARRSLVLLGGVLRMAMADGVIGADPTAGLSVPVPKGDVRPLTVEQVGRVARECHPHELVVWTLALTGVRFGEMAGLRVGDLYVRRRRLRVARSLTSVGGRLVEDLPKPGRRRDVPCPPWLADALAEASTGRGRDEPLLPTSYGKPWRESSWKRIWAGERGKPGARDRAGLPGTRVHDLRHTAASLAIAAGADVKKVQLMLGHSSGVMTIDLYAHLDDKGLDAVAERMGALSVGHTLGHSSDTR